MVSTGVFIFLKIFCPDVGSDYHASLIHLSSQCACETQKSYLHFTNRRLKHRGRNQAGQSPGDMTAETSSASSRARRAVTWSCLGFLLQLVPAQRHKARGSARHSFMYHTLRDCLPIWYVLLMEERLYKQRGR